MKNVMCVHNLTRADVVLTVLHVRHEQSDVDHKPDLTQILRDDQNTQNMFSTLHVHAASSEKSMIMFGRRIFFLFVQIKLISKVNKVDLKEQKRFVFGGSISFLDNSRNAASAVN